MEAEDKKEKGTLKKSAGSKNLWEITDTEILVASCIESPSSSTLSKKREVWFMFTVILAELYISRHLPNTKCEPATKLPGLKINGLRYSCN